MENPQLLAKVNPPNWLKFLVISLIAIGIFFRFSHIGQKFYWGDECYTSLAISGHTLAEVQQEIFNHQAPIPVTTVEKYQHIDPERTVVDTVNYLITSDPQHPPLYYVTVRLWAQVFGDSPVVLRSLSALFSLLIFPSVYWLCLELFESPVVGWIAMALIAVSPLQVVFAQEARQYSLWMVTVLISSAALLRAIRRDNKLCWAVYAFTLTLGLYTHLLTVLVATAFGIYVIISQRRIQTVLNYLLSTAAAFFLFSPWIILFLNNLKTALQLTFGWTLKIIDNPWDRIAIFLMRSTRTFFDINLASDSFWIETFTQESPFEYAFFTLILASSLVVFLLIIFAKIIKKNAVIFIVCLASFTGIFLLVYDLLFGGIRSLLIRYQLPLCLSLEIAIAYGITSYIFAPKTPKKIVGGVIIAGLVIAGLVSDVKLFQAESWWTQIEGQYIMNIAQIINQSESPLLISNNSPIMLGTILALSHRLEPKVHLLSPMDNQLKKIPQDYRHIFLFYRKNSWFDQLEQDEDYSLTYAFQLPGPSGGLWRFEKLARS
jgi:uncharacterized membrane protein